MHQAALQPIESTRWNAVVARDRSVAGAFVYAVRSTGIYCRPGCASRRPRRDRVTFFDTPDRGRGRRVPAVPPMPSAGRRRTRSVGRSDTPRVRLPGERRRAPAPRVARAASGRKPLSSAAQFQADRRHHAASVCGGLPTAACQARAARPEIGDRRDAGRGLRIEQPPVRTGRSQARDDAVNLSPRRCGRADQVHDGRVASRSAAHRCHRARRVPRLNRKVRRRASGTLDREYPNAAVTRDPGKLGRWTRQVLDHLAGRLPRLDSHSTSRRRRSSGRSGRHLPPSRTVRRGRMPT